MPWARRTTIAIAVLAALHLVVIVALLASAPTVRAWVSLGIALAVVPLACGLSLLMARRPDGAVVGALLGLLALAVVHVVTKEVWLEALAQRGDAEQWAWLVAITAENAWWVLVAFALLLLFFPDGQLPSARWRWVPPAMVVGGVVTQVYGAVDPLPFRPPLAGLERPFGTPPEWFSLLSLVAFVAMLLLFLASAASLVIRYRRCTGVPRQQIKWLAVAGIGLPLYPPLCLLEIFVWGEPSWFSGAVGVASLVATPIATAVAVLHHDLYDVDKALVLAVTWGILTVVLLAVYVVASTVTGLVVGSDSAVVVAVGTATALLLLAPLRRVFQRFVDARMYPLRRAVVTAVDRLGQGVSDGTTSPEQLEQVLRAALRDPGLRVGYRVPGTEAYLDTAGLAVQAELGVPVPLAEQQTGVLVPATGTASVTLLREVAAQSSTLVEVVRLRSEVAGALRDAEASRTRLVEIGYKERRRFERDLHDGAQQRLVSLGLGLRLAQRHLSDGTVDIDGLLDESVAELGTAVAELRQIAHGLRPSSLDDGLPAALSNLVRSLPMAVDMDIDATPLPDAVATTAYYVVSEAIANAVKHAEATRIVLQVERVDGQVVVRVRDDGRGGAELGIRSGLADRVAALGGSLEVTSPHGRGTEVRAALPCAS